MSILPKETVKVFAEACGISELEDDVAAALASDLEYKLREMTQEANKFRRHAKRRRLTPEDINLAMRLRNLEPIYGYSTLNQAANEKQHGFRKAGEAGGLSTYYIADEVVDLTQLVNAELPKRPHDVTFTSHWLAIEGVQPKIPQNPGVVTDTAESGANTSASSVVKELLPDANPDAAASGDGAQPAQDVKQLPGATNQAQSTSTGEKGESIDAPTNKRAGNTGPVVYKPITKHELSLEQQLYYQSVTHGMLEHDNQEYCDKAAASLRRDPGLHSLLPYFAQFVAEKVTTNVGEAASLPILSNMVLLTDSLLANENLFPEPYLHQLLPAMLTCTVGKTLSKSPLEDHWSLRRRAAHVVAAVCRKFGSKHRVQSRVTKTMIGAVLDPTKPLATHYGAIVTLTAIGPLVLDAVLMDALEKYDESLTARKANGGGAILISANKVEEALLEACVSYQRWYTSQTQGSTTLPDPDLSRRYQTIMRLFGEKMLVR